MRITTLQSVSHITYIVCVNFIHEGDVTYSLKSSPIFWETFYGNFIYSQSFCVPVEIFDSYFVLLKKSDLGFELWPYV